MNKNLYWVFQELDENHVSFIAEVEAYLFWNAYFEVVGYQKSFVTTVDNTNAPISVEYTDASGDKYVVINMTYTE